MMCQARSPGEGTGLVMASFLQDQGHSLDTQFPFCCVFMSGCLNPPLFPAVGLIINLHQKRFALLSSVTEGLVAWSHFVAAEPQFCHCLWCCSGFSSAQLVCAI